MPGSKRRASADKAGPPDTHSPRTAAPPESSVLGIPGRRLSPIRDEDVDSRLIFRFEFGPAILAQVLEQLEELPLMPLSEAAKSAKFPGFYQIFHNGKSRYIGRTVGRLGARLSNHIKRTRGRIPIEEMTCRYLYVEDLSLVGLSEDTLISYFHPRGLDEWGKSGFGSKVTGYNRAGQTSGWDNLYPPDLELLITAGGERTSIDSLIQEIARHSPITFSVPRWAKARLRSDFPAAFAVPQVRKSFQAWVDDIGARLAPTWRIARQPMAWYVVPVDAELETEAEA